MPYAVTNFKTKKELKAAVAASTAENPVRVYQPGPFGPAVADGECCLEGPHSPEPHRWYAGVVVKNGAVVPGSRVK